MKQQNFEILDSLADAIDEFVHEWFSSEAAKPLMEQLRQATEDVPEIILGMSVQLLAYSEAKKDALRLLTTGVQASDGEPPYFCDGDSSIHRYICDGEICVIPHDQCPNCWGDWDFKETNRTCSDCGYELGKQIKFLLDSDCCPYCEEGTVTADSPICTQCEHEVDLTIVQWG